MQMRLRLRLRIRACQRTYLGEAVICHGSIGREGLALIYNGWASTELLGVQQPKRMRNVGGAESRSGLVVEVR